MLEDDDDQVLIPEKSQRHIYWNKKIKNILVGTSILMTILLSLSFLLSTLIFGQMNRYIFRIETSEKIDVGIVFGAGITPDGKPYKELQARLDVAADALEAGIVKKLILSGDNRFLNYNEPDAMKDYLVSKRSLPEDSLQVDYAGRSTYETCERASKIFSVKKAILFSASSHLPRAIYTCRSFGIESYGIGNDVEANNATRRELIARLKALFNIYIKGENTLLGEPIDLNL